MDYSMNRRAWSPIGNRHPASAPRGCYPCRGDDKWVAISVSSDEEWHALCEAAEHPEWATDPRFSDALNRWRHHDELDAVISTWTANYEHTEVMTLLQGHGVAAGAVLSAPELLENPHFAARGYLPEVDHRQAGTFRSLGVYAKLSKTPGYIAAGRPLLGEHNEYVFGSVLGLTVSEREQLSKEGVTATNPTAVD